MIRIENLSKSFGSTLAVDNVSLEIGQGEIFGLLGPNGAGKTTLINLLSGLKEPDSGGIGFAGFSGIRARKELRRALGLVPQDLAFYLNFSASENLRFFAGLYGLKGRAQRAAVESALAFSGLEEAGKKPAKAFSGGMKRRLNIACGIVHDPSFVILDEPTVGIDPQSRAHILRSVEGLKRRGRTVVYTTHYMEEAESLCDDIAIMDKGKVIARGPQESLKLLVKDSSRVSFYLKRPGGVDLEAFRALPGVRAAELEDLALRVTSEVGSSDLNALTAEVNRQGLALANIESDSPSLETVFLTLTGRSLRD